MDIDLWQLSNRPCVRASVRPCVRASVRPCVRVSVCPCVRAPVRPCVHVSVRPCVRASVRPCVRQWHNLTLFQYSHSFLTRFIVFFKKCQAFHDVERAVHTQVRGVVYTNYSDPRNKGISSRVWDVADYVIPPQVRGHSTPGSLFQSPHIHLVRGQS